MKFLETINDSLKNLLSGLGGSTDKGANSKYMFDGFMEPTELEAVYRSGLGKKLVNAVADDMTRKWRTIIFDENKNKDVSHILSAVETVETEFNVKEVVNEALRWARLYGGAGLLIGIKGESPDSELVVENLKKDCLEYLVVVDRHRLTPNGALCTDITDEAFGLPTSYTLTDSPVIFHHSRVIRFNGQKLPFRIWQANNYWDDSELQHIISDLKNYSATMGNIATMMFEANVDVVQVNNLAEELATKDGTARIISRFQTAMATKSVTKTLILDASETFDKKANSFSGLNTIVIQFMQALCAVADIPMTRLFGMSPGGLNSTGDGDLSNYYDMVNAKQEAELRPRLAKLDQVLLRSALGRMPEDYDFTFNSLWQVSDETKSKIQQARASVDKIYWEMGVVPEGVIARDLKESKTYLNLTDKDVLLADKLSTALEEEPADVKSGKPGEPPPADAKTSKKTEGDETVEKD